MEAIVTYICNNAACVNSANTLHTLLQQQSCDPQHLTTQAQAVAASVLNALKDCPPVVATKLQQLTARDVQGCCADIDRAETLRAKGSTEFGAKHYQTALTTYSQALRCTGAQHCIATVALHNHMNTLTLLYRPCN